MLFFLLYSYFQKNFDFFRISLLGLNKIEGRTLEISAFLSALCVSVFLSGLLLKFFKINLDCHMQAHPSGNYIPIMILPLNYTSSPSMAATFLTIHLMVVQQPFSVTTQKPQCWFGRRTLYRVYTRELDGKLFTGTIST